MANPHKKKTAAEALIWGGAAIAVLVLLNVLVSGSRAKLDVTQFKIYSLTPASRGVVANMPEKVNIKAYFGNVPSEQAEQQNYVDLLLQEYAEASGGKLNYEKFDPWKDKALGEEIRKEGVTPISLQTVKDDSYEQVPMYFHVIFQHLDKKEVWTPGRGFSLEGLEWDFTTRIKRMAYGKKKIGITSGYGEPPGAQVLLQGEQYNLGDLALSDLYEAETVNWAQEPQKIAALDVLVVNGPTEKVSDAALYQLDQFVMQGKPVLFLVSGMKWQGIQQQQMQMEGGPQPYVGMPTESGVAPLLKSYGVEVEQNTLLDVRNTGFIDIPPGGRGGVRAAGFAPVARTEQSGSGNILEGIEGIYVPLASSLKLVGPLEKPEGDTKVIPLLQTGSTTWARKDVVALSSPETVKSVLLAPTAEKGPFLVAVAVNGVFKSYFAGKPVPAAVPAPPAEPSPMPGLDKGEADETPAAPAPPAAQVAQSPSNTRIVVVSAPFIVADAMLMQQGIAGQYINGWKAAHAMVDWLAADQDLVGARAKKVARPIDRLEPGSRNVVKLANIAGGPVMLILFGIIYWRVRDRRRKNVKL
jgi:ABC-2 type transport system permease protein